MRNLVIFFLLLFNIGKINSGFFDFLQFAVPGKKNDQQNRIILSPGVQEKQHKQNILKKEKDNVESSQKGFIDGIQNELNFTNKKIDEIKDKLKEATSTEREFYTDILSKLNELSQILIDTQLRRKNMLTVLNEHIELLESYITNPNFKNKTVEPSASYNFDALDKLQEDISSYEEDLLNLHDEKLSGDAFLENSKKELIAIDKELKIKEREQKRFSAKTKEENKQEKLTLNQKAQLLDTDVRLTFAQKRLADIKIKEEQYKLGLLNTRIFISESILKILKNSLPIVEKALFVSESEVQTFNKSICSLKNQSTELQAKYSEEIRKISQEKEKLKQDLEKLTKKYKINDLKSLSEWSIDPRDIEYEPGLYEAGYLNSKILTHDKTIGLKESQRDFEKERISSEETLSDIIDTWGKLSTRKFKNEEEIDNTRKKYQSLKDELEKDLNNYKEKINIIANIVNNQSKIHGNILDKIRILNEKNEKFISNYGKEQLKKSLHYLSKSEEQIKIQNDLNNKSIENYSNVSSLIKDSIRKINNLLAKLENINAILFRSKYAISWENIKNIIPDLRLFILDLKDLFASYFSTESISGFFEKLESNFSNFSNLFQFILEMLLILIIYFVLKTMLPYIYSYILSTKTAMPGVYFVNCLFALLIGFIDSYFTSIFIWSLIFIFIKLGLITNLAFKTIFYLFSIPYLCLLSHKFVKYLINFNKKYNYLLISHKFTKRFVYVFLFFVYSTIIIFFFIEAFNTITYGKAELPTILLAIYSIIFRACLILLIGKDEILSIIPDNSLFWKWIRKQVDRFYYPILLSIILLMIISDPYIGGFSRLVSFVLWGIVYTILLFTALWWLQIFIRKVSSTIFFKTEEDEATKERFPYAKTFYGFFLVLSFLFFLILAIFMCSKIWGTSISLEKFTEYLNATIFAVRGEGDQIIPITIKSFIVLFSFLFIGFVIAWAFDRFILRRLFNILLVDQGIQNTISNVTYYFILIIILLVGLLRIGLSGMIPFLVGALAVGLAFAIKGPANDFIGYFILLLERTVKIGDYIEIDRETNGVVRKITPRSVIIRKKNSVSVILPNSKITNSAFYNWNYSSNFFAFDDISITVSFNSDPKEVSQILHKTLSENPNVLKSPTPIIRLESFGDNGFVFMARGFLSSVNILNQWDIASDVRIAMVKALQEKNIQIASPVRRILVSDDYDKLKEKI